jgi:hypothetical protein
MARIARLLYCGISTATAASALEGVRGAVSKTFIEPSWCVVE